MYMYVEIKCVQCSDIMWAYVASISPYCNAYLELVQYFHRCLCLLVRYQSVVIDRGRGALILGHLVRLISHSTINKVVPQKLAALGVTNTGLA